MHRHAPQRRCAKYRLNAGKVIKMKRILLSVVMYSVVLIAALAALVHFSSLYTYEGVLSGFVTGVFMMVALLVIPR
jgi:hypothetical protein